MKMSNFKGKWTYIEQPQMQVEIILASIGPDNSPIYTIRMRYPRPLHGEIMTHRVFSRNARSSRAVPTKTLLNEVRTYPYVPWHWGKNQKGMQASKECNELVSIGEDKNLRLLNREAWLRARDTACDTAEAFMEAGYHKQNSNRLLEPFSWIDTLITSTQWDNFFWLRNHHMAEPHLQDLVKLVKNAIETVTVTSLEFNEWHLPYITHKDWDAAETKEKPKNMSTIDFLLQISAARCARISYTPFDGDASYKKELIRYNQLVTSNRVHASPLEHQATPDSITGHISFPITYGIKTKLTPIWKNPHLHGNLPGWIQARKLVHNEVYIE